MLNSKLIELIKGFDSFEFTEFEKFLNSPYFNHREDIKQLYNYILEINKQRKRGTTHLEKEVVFEVLFPGEKFDGEKLRRLRSELSLVIKDYMAIREVKFDSRLKQKLYLKSIHDRKITNEHFKELGKRIKKIDGEKNKTVDSYLELYFDYKDFHLQPKNPGLDSTLNYIELAHKNLDLFYMLSKLHICCELVNRQLAFDNKQNIPLLKEVLSEAKKIENEYPLIKMYLEILDCLQSDFKGTQVKDIDSLFFQNIKSLTDKCQFDVFLLLSNIINRAINNGDLNSVSILLEHYQKGLSKKIIPYRKLISKETFTNIVILASFEKQFKWLEDFIDEYSIFLPNAAEERTIEFCNGYIEFCKGNFEEANQLLDNHSFDKSSFDIRTKFIVIRSMFELCFSKKNKTYFKTLNYRIESFQKYVPRKAIGIEKKSSYLNFALFTKRLANLINNMKDTDAKRGKLEIELMEESNLFGKLWLLEKVNSK